MTVPTVAAALVRRPSSGGSAPSRARRSSGSRRRTSPGGFLLGVVAYGWVVLPFVQGGPRRVRAVWAAKFLNRGPDGKPLP